MNKTGEQSNTPPTQTRPDPLLNPSPDPWEDTETAHLRAFLKLTYTERFRLLMHALEFMNMLRPLETVHDRDVERPDS